MTSQIECPKCGNYKTKPYTPGFVENERKAMDSILKDLGIGKGDTFENPKYVSKFRAGEIKAKCDYCGLVFDSKTVIEQSSATNSLTSDTSARQRSPLERLSELEKIDSIENKRLKFGGDAHGG